MRLCGAFCGALLRAFRQRRVVALRRQALRLARLVWRLSFGPSRWMAVRCPWRRAVLVTKTKVRRQDCVLGQLRPVALKRGRGLLVAYLLSVASDRELGGVMVRMVGYLWWRGGMRDPKGTKRTKSRQASGVVESDHHVTTIETLQVGGDAIAPFAAHATPRTGSYSVPPATTNPHRGCQACTTQSWLQSKLRNPPPDHIYLSSYGNVHRGCLLSLLH